MSIFRATTTIRNILKEDAALVELLGQTDEVNKIFPIIAPEATKGNFIIYQRDEYNQTRDKLNMVLQETSNIFITAVSDDYDESINIIERVYELLCVGTRAYNIQIVDATEEVDQSKYVQTIKFELSLK